MQEGIQIGKVTNDTECLKVLHNYKSKYWLLDMVIGNLYQLWTVFGCIWQKSGAQNRKFWESCRSFTTSSLSQASSISLSSAYSFSSLWSYYDHIMAVPSPDSHLLSKLGSRRKRKSQRGKCSTFFIRKTHLPRNPL